MELQSELLSLMDFTAMVGSGLEVVKPVLSSCPECEQNSRVGALRNYDVNLEESLIICDNQLCCYMSSQSEIKEPDKGDGMPGSADDLVQSDTNHIFSSLFSHDLETLGEPTECKNQSPARSAEPNSILPPSIFLDSTSLDPNLSIPDNSRVERSDELIDSKTNDSSGSLACDEKDILCFSSTEVENEVPNVSTTISNCAISTNSLLPESPLCLASAVAQVPSRAPTTNSHKHRYIILWSNIDALCWLDVLLCMLCHNNSVQAVSKSLPYSSIIKKLLLAYDESQKLIEPLQDGDSTLLRTVMDQDRTDVKLGETMPMCPICGGYCMETAAAMSATLPESRALSSQEIASAKRKVHLAHIKLECAREEIWQMIEPLSCYKRGTDGSPVRALPLIVKPDKSVSDLFRTEYSWAFKCTVCHHTQNSRENELLITFPKISRFEIDENIITLYKVDCPKCMAPNQKKWLTLNRLSSNLVIHFADGMTQFDLNTLNFTCGKGTSYIVSAVVEYKTSPNHFALWQRDIKPGKAADQWMCYDDLKSKYAQFCLNEFKVPPHNIHIVFWESFMTKKPKAVSKSKECPASNNTFTPYHNTKLPVVMTNQTASSISCVGQMRSSDFSNNEAMLITTKSTPNLDMLAPERTSSQVIVTPKAQTFKSEPRKPVLGGLGSLSKSLRVGKYNQSQLLPIPLAVATENTDSNNSPAAPSLIANAPSKATLSTGLNYGSGISQTDLVGNTRSYNDIMGALSALSPKEHGNESTRANVCKSKLKPDSASTKTYLDLVKPLLQKNKLQKGKALMGYVPKSKRQSKETTTSPAKSKRKRVMFSGVSDNEAKGRPKSVRAALSVAEIEDQVDKTVRKSPSASATPVALFSPVNATKNKAKAQNLMDNFVPCNLKVDEPLQSNELFDDMPTLDDMLNDLF